MLVAIIVSALWLSCSLNIVFLLMIYDAWRGQSDKSRSIKALDFASSKLFPETEAGE